MTQNSPTFGNGLESAVFRSVLYRAARYPSVAADDELITAVAGMALNHLPARYARSSDAPIREDEAIDNAVLAAFDRVYERTALTARETVINVHAEIECAGAS